MEKYWKDVLDILKRLEGLVRRIRDEGKFLGSDGDWLKYFKYRSYMCSFMWNSGYMVFYKFVDDGV